MTKALLSFYEGGKAIGISERAIKSPLWRERLAAAGALVEPTPGRVRIIASRLDAVIAALPAPAKRAEPSQLAAGKAAKALKV